MDLDFKCVIVRIFATCKQICLISNDNYSVKLYCEFIFDILIYNMIFE